MFAAVLGTGCHEKYGPWKMVSIPKIIQLVNYTNILRKSDRDRLALCGTNFIFSINEFEFMGASEFLAQWRYEVLALFGSGNDQDRGNALCSPSQRTYSS